MSFIKNNYGPNYDPKFARFMSRSVFLNVGHFKMGEVQLP